MNLVLRGRALATVIAACAAGVCLAVSTPAQDSSQPASQPEKITMRGRVVGPKGEPVAAARIFFGGLDGQGVVVKQLSAPTDADGRYECPVERGWYLISISALPEKYTAPIVDQYERRNVQKDTDWGDFAVRAARSVEFIVVDESGKPVADAGVRIAMFAPQFFETRNGRWASVPTDAEGRVTFRNLDDEDRYAVYAAAGERTSDGPVMITPSEVTGPVRIPISAATAARIVGRVVDSAGEGVAEADVSIFWTVLNTGRFSGLHSGSHRLTRVKTDEKGAFVCTGLWPGDRYRVSVQKRGYSASDDDAEQLAVRGQDAEFAPIVLKKLGDGPAGRVVDVDGKPVAGARVFLTFSSPKAETDESGRFQIAESPTPSAMVLVEKEGYRLAAFAVGPNRKADLVIRRTEAGPPPRPPELPDEERVAIARELLNTLWTRSWSPRQRPSADLVRAMAKLDTAAATEWSAQCDGAHDAIVRQQRAEKLLAAGDIQSAVSLLAAQKPANALRALSPAIDRLTPSEPDKALKIAEETLAIVRGMDQMQATPHLARLGRQLILLKKTDAGRKLIEEAAAVLPQVGAAPMSTYYYREIAGGLAAIDVEKALSIPGSIKVPHERNSALGTVIRVASRFDPQRAAALLERIDDGSQRNQVQVQVAVELGESDWNSGVQLAEKISQVGYRSQAFGWLAVQRAKTNPAGAHALLARALDDLIKERESLELFASSGGVFGAHLAVLAAQLNHPDLDVIVAGALGLRGGPRGGGPHDDWVSGNVTMFGLLGLADPALAREALTTLISVQERVPERGLGRAEWIAAWAVIDPALVPEMVLEAVSKLTDERTDLFFAGVTPAISALTTPPAQRVAGDFVLYRNAPIWFPGEDH